MASLPYERPRSILYRYWASRPRFRPLRYQKASLMHPPSACWSQYCIHRFRFGKNICFKYKSLENGLERQLGQRFLKRNRRCKLCKNGKLTQKVADWNSCSHPREPTLQHSRGEEEYFLKASCFSSYTSGFALLFCCSDAACPYPHKLAHALIYVDCGSSLRFGLLHGAGLPEKATTPSSKAPS